MNLLRVLCRARTAAFISNRTRRDTEDRQGDTALRSRTAARREAGDSVTNGGENRDTHRRSSRSAEGDTRAGLQPRGQHDPMLPAAERETIPLAAAREQLR